MRRLLDLRLAQPGPQVPAMRARKEVGMPDYISITEAGEITGIDRKVLYRLIYTKRIPFIVVNPNAKRLTYKIRLEGLRKYLASAEGKVS